MLNNDSILCLHNYILRECLACTFSSKCLLRKSHDLKYATVRIKLRKWHVFQAVMHFSTTLIGCRKTNTTRKECLLGECTHIFGTYIDLIHSICCKPKSVRESLTKMSSLKQGDISFSPSALFRLLATEMLPAAPVSNFSKLSLPSKSA